mgnify:CR=1 FL=1
MCIRDRPKKDYFKKLLHDIKRINSLIPINMSTSSDPYPPEELTSNITRKTLELLIPLGFKILITTKGTVFIRDLDLIAKGNVALMMTITTLDEKLASKIEPGAPKPKYRIKALEEAHKNDVPIGARVDPIIPYLNDDPLEIKRLISELVSVGVKFIVTSTYKVKSDNFKRMVNAFPELESKWRRLYYLEGERIEGYRYLPTPMRKRLLKIVLEQARAMGVEYATCREGLKGNEWFKARSCDGTHLIPRRIPIKIIG